jgi:very-short-patch-repair endonuclease
MLLNDKIRQELIENDGMKLLHFSNEQILTALEEVTIEIEKYIGKKDER